MELYARIEKSDKQLSYYNSGIGTFANPSRKLSWSYLTMVADNKIDLAIAWYDLFSFVSTSKQPQSSPGTLRKLLSLPIAGYQTILALVIRSSCLVQLFHHSYMASSEYADHCRFLTWRISSQDPSGYDTKSMVAKLDVKGAIC